MLVVVGVKTVDERSPMLRAKMADVVDVEDALELCDMDTKVLRRTGVGAEHVFVVESEHCGPVYMLLLQHAHRPIILLGTISGLSRSVQWNIS